MPTQRRGRDPGSQEPVALRVPAAQFREELENRIRLGSTLLERATSRVEGDVDDLETHVRKFNEYNETLLRSRFTTSEIADAYGWFVPIITSGYEPQGPGHRLSRLQDLLQERLGRLDSLYERIDLYDVRDTDAGLVAAGGSSAGGTAGSQRHVTYNISGPVAQMNVGDRQLVENIQSHLAGMDARGQQQVAIGLKAISEAAVSDPELNAETRAEVLEAIEDISEGAAALPAMRRRGRVKRALEFLATTAKAATALGGAWEQWRPVIEQHLSRG